MSDIELYSDSFPLTGDRVRCVLMGDDVFFAGADICKALGISHAPAAFARLDESEKLILTSEDVASIGKPDSWMPNAGRLTLLTEPGLYTLILRSNKPNAAPFRKWVVSDLLPSIRRGDAKVSEQATQMRRTLGQAIGTEIDVVAVVRSSKKVDVEQLADETVRCSHGQMDRFVSKTKLDIDGGPFVYFRCPAITGRDHRGRVQTECGTWAPVQAARKETKTEVVVLDPPEAVPVRTLFMDTPSGRIYGTPEELAAFVRALS